jgi:hypothetical protein
MAWRLRLAPVKDRFRLLQASMGNLWRVCGVLADAGGLCALGP